MQPDKQVERTIPFAGEDGEAYYVEVTSSIGNIPVRIDSVDIIEEGAETSKVSVNYQIDSDHPDCPDLEQIDESETLRIMETLKNRVPEFIKQVLVEAAEQESGETIPS